MTREKFSIKAIYLIFLGTAIIHSCLRLYLPTHSVFDYDQEMISEKAYLVSHDHKPTLVGTKVGEYSFHIPPLFIYSSAVFLKVFNFHPLAIYWQAFFYSGLSLMGIYWLLKPLIHRIGAVAAMLLYSVSPFFLNFDRVPSNLNPLLTLSIVNLILLYQIINQKATKLTKYLLLGVVVSLGFNCHFTAIFLLLLDLLCLVIYKKINWKKFAVFIAPFLINLLPIIIFDWRHQWLNYQGIISFINRQETQIPLATILINFINQLIILMENVGKVLLPYNYPGYAIIGATAAIAFIRKNNNKKLKVIAGLSGLIPAIIFSFYQGAKPEYYYLTVYPTILVIYGCLLGKILRHKSNLVCFILLLSIFMLLNQQRIKKTSFFQLQNKLQVLETIKNSASDKAIRIHYITPPGDAFGYRYLINFLKIKTNHEAIIDYTIVYPASKYKFDYCFKSGEIGLTCPNDNPL